jgi:hypothetical protein
MKEAENSSDYQAMFTNTLGLFRLGFADRDDQETVLSGRWVVQLQNWKGSSHLPDPMQRVSRLPTAP